MPTEALTMNGLDFVMVFRGYFKFKLFLMLLLYLGGPSAAFAVDGSAGINSTGSSNISVLIGKLIVARNFSDFSFGTYTYGSGDLNGDDDLNIASTYASITYQVVLNGSGTAGAFTISNGTSTIPYLAYYNDATGTSGRVTATSGVPITGQLGAVDPIEDLTLNANVSMQILQADLDTADYGTYSGSLALIFQPE